MDLIPLLQSFMVCYSFGNDTGGLAVHLLTDEIRISLDHLSAVILPASQADIADLLFTVDDTGDI